LLEHRPFHCFAEDHVRDFLFVEDVAEAIATLVASQLEGVVEIGSGEGVKLGSVAKEVARELKAEHHLTLTSAPHLPDNPSKLVANPKRLKEEVGFCPRYTLESGLKQTILWWKNEISYRYRIGNFES